MKLNTNVAEVQSTFVGEDVEMRIQQESMAHIMEILAGLYQNRLLAVIREYSTNALDAHIDAGVSLPFDVTLPTGLTPFFKVRDYGNGLDANGIREIYSQYGASTARRTNDQVGGFGLGAKSALAYNSKSFTVVSVKDGRKIHVLVSIDEHGVGNMKLVGNPEGEPTDEVSGTEITIAIAREDIDRCEKEAKNFYKFWEPGKVLVNGREPRHFRAEAFHLTDSLYMVEQDAGYDSDVIVMGNVAYRQKIDVGFDRGYNSYKIVAIIPIGSAIPVPSREALKDVPTTKNTIKKVGEDFVAALQGAIQREIDASPTPSDALKIVVKWARYMPGNKRSASNYQYQGHTMPEAYEPPLLSKDYWSRVEATDFSTSQHYRGTVSKYKQWDSKLWHQTLWLTNFDLQKFNATHKDKIMYWAKTNLVGFEEVTGPDGKVAEVRRSGDLQHIVICHDGGPSGDDDAFFLNPKHMVDYETIKAIRLPKEVLQSRGMSNHIAGSFRAYTETGYQDMLKGDDIRQDQPIMYINGNQHEGRGYNNALKAFYPNYTLVCLPANRVEKFKRDVSKAIDIYVALDQGFKAWVASIPNDERAALAMHDDNQLGDYRIIDTARVNDPALKRAALLARKDIAKWITARKQFQYVVTSEIPRGVYPDVLGTKYPLFQAALLRSHPDEMYDYLNHVYATKG